MKCTVVVTGANGFIGGHVVEELLKHGHTVRAAVRDPESPKCQFLKELGEKYGQEESGGQLTLHKADLTEEGSFTEVFRGSDVVIHTASPVNDGVKDPQRELVEPAVTGTLNVLRCMEASGVRRVVVTSSVASIEGVAKGRPLNQLFTEEDFNRDCRVDYGAYPFSKVSAENATMEFLAKQPEAERFGYVSIHPSLVVGPQQNGLITSSQQVLTLIANREYPVYPPMVFSTVDVRDVAKAHRLAAEALVAGNPKAHGRFLCTNGKQIWMNEIGMLMKKRRPELRLASYTMPRAALWLTSFFDSRITKYFLDTVTVIRPEFDGTKICRDLGFTYDYTIETSLGDAIDSFVHYGIVKP